ncbi:MAG: hypothetical protein R3332_05515 [Pseudohongiellaceae bacterium]|nr:hypothetical protein [Pseudohongiellaceae bacterium]
MKCAEFQSQLPVMLKQQLDTGSLVIAEQHLATCPQCLLRWSEAVEAMQAPAQNRNFSANVLSAMGMDPCAAALDALCEQSGLENRIDDTVALHLETCASCAELSLTLQQLNFELPSLRELPVPPGFTARTLKALGQTGRQQETDSAPSTWQQKLRGIARRPRFAIEASYVLSLCLVLAVASPTFGGNGLEEVNDLITSARDLGEQQYQILKQQNDLLMRSSKEQWNKIYDTTYVQIATNTKRTQQWFNQQTTQLLESFESAQQTLFGGEEPSQNI